jgi:hypothetical protein
MTTRELIAILQESLVTYGDVPVRLSPITSPPDLDDPRADVDTDVGGLCAVKLEGGPDEVDHIAICDEQLYQALDGPVLSGE